MPEEILALPPVPADLRQRYGPHASQFFDIYQPAQPVQATVVMIHGGFWRNRYDLLHTSHLCDALAQEGYAAANLEYRRVGDEGGGWPGTADDVKLGVAKALEALPHPRRLVLGHSAGGHLALRLASQPIVLTAVIALAAVACLDLAQDLHLSNNALDEFLRDHDLTDADPSRHSATAPRTLLHGALDTDVPIDLSRSFLDRRQHDEPSPELIELPQSDHFDLIDPKSTEAWPALLTVLQRYSLAQWW